MPALHRGAGWRRILASAGLAAAATRVFEAGLICPWEGLDFCCGKMRQTSRRNGAAHHEPPANAVRIRNTCDDIAVVELLPRVQVPTLVLRCRHDNGLRSSRTACSPARLRAPNSWRSRARITWLWPASRPGPGSSARSRLSWRS